MCHIQRSRGYLQRNAFDLETIRKIADTARAANPDIIIFVDNCYGEFTQTQEPCQMGADLVVGSLIKNPGGGIAPTGGYIAGRKDLVELCAYRLNAPGLGKDLGCTLETPRDYVSGLLLCARRGVRGHQDRHLRPVYAGAAGQESSAALLRRPQRHRHLL